MKDNRYRILFIIVVTLLAAWAASDFSKYRRGPDLEGGTILIYEVGKDVNRSRLSMDTLATALKERLDPAGLFQYVIRPLGSDRVEIIMPKAQSDDVERVKRLVSTVGELSFRIVANRRRHEDLIDRAEVTWPEKRVGLAEAPEGLFVTFGSYVPLNANAADNEALVKQAEAGWPTRKVTDSVKYIPLPPPELNKPQNTANWAIKRDDAGRQWVLASWNDDGVNVNNVENLVKIDEQGDRYVLVYLDDHKVTGGYLTSVYPTMHESEPAVAFNFNGEGAQRFYQLTSEFAPENDGYLHQLGVILDNRLRSAPNLRARISNSGVISGRFTRQEVDELVQILDAGQLPYALEKTPTSTFQMGPLLGADTIVKATRSIYLSMAVVFGFMLIYYRWVGSIAVFALILNLLYTIALMVMFKATWTLPGMAGIVLTVGMSVDANVLIYERMREELDRGASLGLAIRNGYDKAWLTIFDTNTTAILTALILFAIGTDQVKGFAVTLILGIATSMFSAVTVTRVIFDVLYSKRWLKKLSMMRMVGTTNFQFMKYSRPAIFGSLVVIAIGMIALAIRGRNNLDIDFTGGTLVGLHFNQRLDTADVRRMASEVLADVSVEDIQLEGEEPGRRFFIRTTEREEGSTSVTVEGTVLNRLSKVFRQYLDTPSVTVSAVQKIAKPEPGKEADEAAKAAAQFPEGEKATLEFSKEQKRPRTLQYVRNHLLALIHEREPGVANAEDRFAVIPGEVADETAAEKTYSSFTVATAGGAKDLLEGFKERVAAIPDIDQFSQFGPQVAGETQNRALFAIFASWVCIIAYVWLRFGSWAFGLAGVVALVHDVLVSVGMIALVSILASNIPGLENIGLYEMKIDLTTVASVLTLIGYSINDTIVIFDRVREIRGKTHRLTSEMIDRALNETLSRTIITALFVLFVVTILYFGGGAGLRSFSFVLVIGAIVGTYSTVYIAAPVLLTFVDYQQRRRAEKASSRPSASAAAF